MGGVLGEGIIGVMCLLGFPSHLGSGGPQLWGLVGIRGSWGSWLLGGQSHWSDGFGGSQPFRVGVLGVCGYGEVWFGVCGCLGPGSLGLRFLGGGSTVIWGWSHWELWLWGLAVIRASGFLGFGVRVLGSMLM